ncbi:MAG: hypothetical protein KDA93_18705 [Planctomycetaceae bacterium]|nr:hypothetical protein [Planctomycetaceae bacterium]
MSPRGSKKSTDAQPDVYTGLLFISVASLIAGCIFLALELSKYDWSVPG